MPPADSNLDPNSILDEWANRVINLPEEIAFVQNEIADKDRQANEVIKKIEDSDGRIQKWIRIHGSHVSNPQQAALDKAVLDNFAIADQLAREKIALTIRMQNIMDKHLRNLDAQIKMLYDRGEPGFNDPDELPSLLRPPPASSHAPSPRPSNPTTASNPASAALHPLANLSGSLGPKGANTQLRNIQTTQFGTAAASSSAPVSPAASMILKRGARETSAGPGSGVPSRPRLNTNLTNLGNPSSGLARHSSLGPGTPKGHTASGHQRSGSAGPGARGGVKGGASTLPMRKGTPSGGGRGSTKKSSGAVSAISSGAGCSSGAGGGGMSGSGPMPKSGLQRVRKTAKNSPSSTAESELSDADSVASSNDSDAPVSQRSGRGTPARSGGGNHSHSNSATSISRPPPHAGGGGGPNSHRPGGGAPRTKRDDHHHHNPNDLSYVDEDEGNDDRKYCICHKVSFGDMVACDNDHCPYEWFHWSCVGLKSEPTGGEWYCPVCVKEREEKIA